MVFGRVLAGYEELGFANPLGFVDQLVGGNELVATNTLPIPYQTGR